MKVIENFDLTNYNSYRLSAKCSKVYFPDCEDDMLWVYSENKQESVKIIGNGNNVILTKENYLEVFVILNGNFNEVEVQSDIIGAQAGASMEDLSNVALRNNLSGLEIFNDIPSSVGGAVVMNAGAGGEEVKDLLVKVRYLDLCDFKIKELACDNMEFEYRNSYFQKHSDKIVLKAWFKLSKASYSDIESKMIQLKQQRWAKQPREFPNCGSVFKRPKGYFVGQIIEELALKGFSIGGAKISEKHGGFIVNYNNAKGSDIVEIINEVKRRVKDKYSVDLEVEQRML